MSPLLAREASFFHNECPRSLRAKPHFSITNVPAPCARSLIFPKRMSPLLAREASFFHNECPRLLRARVSMFSLVLLRVYVSSNITALTNKGSKTNGHQKERFTIIG